MGLFSTIKSFFTKKSEPSYTIYTGGTPAGETRTTSGGTISTPGTTATPGIYGTYGGGGSSGGSSSGGSSGGGQVTTQDLPPVTQPAIKSIDVGTATQDRIGYVTTRGGSVSDYYGVSQLQAQRIAETRQQTQQGFSGRVEVSSPSGRPEETRFLVRGEEVAVTRAGEKTFEPRGAVARGGKATITIDRPGEQRVIEISRGEMIEREFQARQSSAMGMVFGEGAPPTQPNLNLSVVEQQDLEAEQNRTSLLQNVGDFFTAGGVTASRLGKKQGKLNEDIESFNLKFGNQSLSEQGFAEAQKESETLSRRQEAIDRTRETKVSAPSYRLSSYIFGTFGKGALEEQPKVYADSFPLTPGFALPKITNVQFVGTQAIKGSQVETQLLFAGGGRVGVSVGRTTTRGEIAESIAGGMVGKGGVGGFTAQPKIKGVQTFLAREISVSSRATSIPATKSFGVGESVSARGEKIIRTGAEFPTGRIVQRPARLSRDLFASESVAFQKENLALIVGRTKTLRGQEVRFRGLLKLDTGGDIASTGTGALRLKKSFDSAISPAIAQVVRQPSQVQRVVTSTTNTGQVFSQPSKSQPAVFQRAGVQAPSTLATQNKEIAKLSRTFIQPSRTRSRTGQTTSQLTGQSQVQKSVLGEIQIPKQSQVSTTRQLQRTLQMQKAVQQQRLFQRGGFGFKSVVPRIPKIPFFKFQRKPTQQSSGFGGYSVFIRRFGKFRPYATNVSFKQAEGIGRYITGSTLARSFKILSPSGKPVRAGTDFRFRTAKRDPSIVVEKSRFALNTPSELREIFSFKGFSQRRRKRKR